MNASWGFREVQKYLIFNHPRQCEKHHSWRQMATAASSPTRTINSSNASGMNIWHTKPAGDSSFNTAMPPTYSCQWRLSPCRANGRRISSWSLPGGAQTVGHQRSQFFKKRFFLSDLLECFLWIKRPSEEWDPLKTRESHSRVHIWEKHVQNTNSTFHSLK